MQKGDGVCQFLKRGALHPALLTFRGKLLKKVLSLQDRSLRPTFWAKVTFVIAEISENILIQLQEAVDKFPDFVRYIVTQMKILFPKIGKHRIAKILARAGLHLGPTTVKSSLVAIFMDSALALLLVDCRGDGSLLTAFCRLCFFSEKTFIQ